MGHRRSAELKYDREHDILTRRSVCGLWDLAKDVEVLLKVRAVLGDLMIEV